MTRLPLQEVTHNVFWNPSRIALQRPVRNKRQLRSLHEGGALGPSVAVVENHDLLKTTLGLSFVSDSSCLDQSRLN